jgi:hypothetical protein
MSVKKAPIVTRAAVEKAIARRQEEAAFKPGPPPETYVGAHDNKRHVMAMVEPDLDALKAAGKVFDSGGTGRKECPTCGNHIYFQAGRCPVCDHEFARKPRGMGKAGGGIKINSNTIQAISLVKEFIDYCGNDTENCLVSVSKVVELIDVFGSEEAVEQAIIAINGPIPAGE